MINGAFVLHDILVKGQQWRFSNMDVLKESVKKTHPREHVNFKKMGSMEDDKQALFHIIINGNLNYIAWWDKYSIITRPSIL